MEKNTILRIVEVIVLGGIMAAFILPIFSPADETNEIESTRLIRITN